MILLIDSYDSFTNNLSQLVRDTTGKKVITIHNDTYKPAEYESFFTDFLPMFDYIVIGPGPGHPANPSDIGIISWLLQKYKLQEDLNQAAVPILGICLGFQSICYEFDNEVLKLESVKHGQIYDVYPMEVNELFKSLSPFPSVRYHSLYVDIEQLSDALKPLAYCIDESDKKILMAVKHIRLPFYGVQYHPESICSEGGIELVRNFDELAENYNKLCNRTLKKSESQEYVNESIAFESSVHPLGLISSGKLRTTSRASTNLYFTKFQMPQDINSVGVCNYFYQKKTPFFLLNSASFPGEWSIIGLPTPGKSEVITHSVDENDKIKISLYGSPESRKTILLGSCSAWNFVGEKFREKYIPRENFGSIHTRDVPFLGGYLGIISYEEGQHIIIEKLDSITNPEIDCTPDLKLVYIERFMVFDHVTKDWFIISINQDNQHEQLWCEKLAEELTSHLADGELVIEKSNVPDSINDFVLPQDSDIAFELPSRDIYKNQFEKCQEYLHSGDSYELCLTTQLKIRLPSNIKAWEMYKVLTIKKNPSPFSCFMEFDDVTLISSSPERFLSWKDNSVTKKKMVELRPIKGTVKNTKDMTYETAHKILKTPKEMGENLMIVDLIRHDLHSFIEKVTVDQLMSVEEYKTVFQLVSVIRGELSSDSSFNGLDILRESLPPGSMTGAPKKRSIELLQDIESLQTTSIGGGRRGIYSGVVGYWSVTDDSDWSVIIRSLFHYNNDKENTDDVKLWRIGAGGAITVLSEVDSEWEEMKVKLTSVLQSFQ